MKYGRVINFSFLSIATLLLAIPIHSQTSNEVEDPYLWLEEIESENSLEWVKAHDQITIDEFMSDSVFTQMQSDDEKLLLSKEKIPYCSMYGDYLYNFWNDDEHVRGILRRTSLEEYNKAIPNWELVLDIDKLNEDENAQWVYKGSSPFPPDYKRTLISLSEGGGDATVVREFDLETKEFVKDGFTLPEAKSSASWYDINTLIVGTDFGEGTMTESGYPRIVKLWKRGTPLSEAETIFEGDNSDVSVGAYVDFEKDENIFHLYKGVSFWESKRWILDDGMNKVELPFPLDVSLKAYFKGYFILFLNSEWFGIPEGSLVAVKKSDITSSNLASKVEVIIYPKERSAVKSVYKLQDFLVVSKLTNVVSEMMSIELEETDTGSKWVKRDITIPDFGSAFLMTYSKHTNNFMLLYTSFLKPSTLYYYENINSRPEKIKALPDMFDASGYEVSQHEAKSKDGTMIPYFLVSPEDMKLDGQNAVLLYGYGGFRISETPFYWSSMGKLWLEKGGVFALANIRGGGEFGPAWHKAALLENRQKCYDDFIAISEDLINTNVTSPKKLGIMGGSNGGLLVGAAITQRPDLYNAAVCRVPLLDMLRYHKLPPGASWMAEYGDPDIPEQRAFIKKYSPYQNLKKGIVYPEILFVTSTKDDRVHPGHARKMAARMEEYGSKIYFYEEMQGGHGMAADNLQRAKRHALEFNYLYKKLILDEPDM